MTVTSYNIKIVKKSVKKKLSVGFVLKGNRDEVADPASSLQEAEIFDDICTIIEDTILDKYVVDGDIYDRRDKDVIHYRGLRYGTECNAMLPSRRCRHRSDLLQETGHDKMKKRTK